MSDIRERNEKKEEFLNNFYGLFPAFFDSDNPKSKYWDAAYNAVFRQLGNPEIDYDRLYITILQNVKRFNTPPNIEDFRGYVSSCIINKQNNPVKTVCTLTADARGVSYDIAVVEGESIEEAKRRLVARGLKNVRIKEERQSIINA